MTFRSRPNSETVYNRSVIGYPFSPACLTYTATGQIQGFSLEWRQNLTLTPRLAVSALLLYLPTSRPEVADAALLIGWDAKNTWA